MSASFLIRCTAAEADAIRRQAKQEHRTINGCLWHILDRNLWIEETYWTGLSRSSEMTRRARTEDDVALHFRCTAEQARRIRRAAARRKMSISFFVLFLFNRHRQAIKQIVAATKAEGDLVGAGDEVKVWPRIAPPRARKD